MTKKKRASVLPSCLKSRSGPGDSFSRSNRACSASTIVDDDGEMAVAVAERVGLLAIEVDGQFDLERRGGMAQIDQCEVRKS